MDCRFRGNDVGPLKTVVPVKTAIPVEIIAPTGTRPGVTVRTAAGDVPGRK